MVQNMLINPAGLADGTGRAHRCHFLENNMIIVYYYIGMLIGAAVVLLCYFVSRRAGKARKCSMCNTCKYMTFKDWNGRKWCREKTYWFYLSPKYCSLYKEREGTND